MLLVNVALLAQEPQLPFTYRLLPTNDPASVSNVKFISNIPESASGISWDFGDGGASTDRNPVHAYSYKANAENKFLVKLTYSGLSTPFEQEIIVNPAFFAVTPDLNLGDLATLKKVMRSAFNFSINNSDSIGNMRFYWEIDGVDLEGNAFAVGFGQYPNIYHTFPKGGLHTIYLKVTNSSVSNTNYAEYSTSITLLPPVSTTKLDFVNLPEYITPNGDSVNDYFEVTATGTTSLSFMVFSRSGSVVYQQEANIIKWDGTNYYGKELPEGIYYFTIEDKGNLYNPAKGFFYIFRGKK